MPRGPQAEKRPAEVIGAAVMVDKIATGEKILALKTTRRGGNALNDVPIALADIDRDAQPTDNLAGL